MLLNCGVGQDFFFFFWHYPFIFLFFKFTILYWFCHISKWIHHRYTSVPHPDPSSLLPPHTIPLGRPSAPAPSNQYCASNLDWRLVSYMILYMFQCHSPKSSLPLPLLQSRLLRVPWTTRRSDQSILKEISPEYSLEGLMLKLKLQYFGHLMWRADSFEKTLMLGKI